MAEKTPSKTLSEKFSQAPTWLQVIALVGGVIAVANLASSVLGYMDRKFDEQMDKFMYYVWWPASPTERFIIAGIAVIVVLLLFNSNSKNST